MGYKLEEACKVCPECVQCRLAGETYKVFFCDSCGEEYDSDELRQYEGEAICRECFLEMMDEQWSNMPCVKEDQL